MLCDLRCRLPVPILGLGEEERTIVLRQVLPQEFSAAESTNPRLLHIWASPGAQGGVNETGLNNKEEVVAEGEGRGGVYNGVRSA